jgi:hypothetical protein
LEERFVSENTIVEKIKNFMRSKMLWAIIIGFVMVATDMKFGWISLFLGGLSSVLLIALVVGVIAGTFRDGIIAMLGTLVLSVFGIALLMPFLYPEWLTAFAPFFIPIDILRVSFVIVQQSSTLGTTGQPWYLVGEFFPGEIGFGTVIFTPFIFGIALFIGGVGGYIMTRVMSKPSSQEPAPVTPEPAAQSSDQ